jgi:hypothetical protein
MKLEHTRKVKPLRLEHPDPIDIKGIPVDLATVDELDVFDKSPKPKKKKAKKT